MCEETLPVQKSRRIVSAIEVRSWILGPWSDATLDFEGIFGGEPAKDVLHEGWVAMFTAAEQSQTMSIVWNDRNSSPAMVAMRLPSRPW